MSRDHIAALIGLVIGFGIASVACLVSVVASEADQDARLDALEDRPACTCQPEPIWDPLTPDRYPATDGRVEWETWQRVDGRASK